MASSNIKLFDENKGNMLTDTEFNISTQRLNGLQTGVASSQLQNKAMYQVSLVAYAIAQIMLQNGLNANDTDAVSTFVSNLSGTMLQKVYDIATTEEAKAGVVNGKWMSPALVKAEIDVLAAKAQNILSDKTKALYGLGIDAVPDDVFMKLAVPASYYGFDITVKFSDGTPIPGVPLNGLQSLSLGDVFTDENGKCFALASTKTATVTISNYIGVTDTETSISAEDGVAFTPVNITLERDTSLHLIQESKTIKVLTGVPVDMCIVGGGASGIFTKVESVNGGYGGGGGFAKNILGVVLVNPNVELVVGAGGEKSTTTQNVSNAGGDSSVTYDGTTITAQGSPGVNGNGSHGGDGTTRVFNDDSLPLPGGSGGTGKVGAPANDGGKDFGGRGVYWGSGVPVYATNGRGPGGGGGGGASDGRQHGYPGSGAAGGLYIRVNAPEVRA